MQRTVLYFVVPLQQLLLRGPRNRGCCLNFVLRISTMLSPQPRFVEDFTDLFLGDWLILAGQSVPLRLDALLSSLAGSLGLGTFGIHLLLERSLAGSFGFGFVDLKRMSCQCCPDGFYTTGWAYVFNQSALVLESVTLAEMVEFVVEMLVDLAGGTIFDQETAEHA